MVRMLALEKCPGLLQVQVWIQNPVILYMKVPSIYIFYIYILSMYVYPVIYYKLDIPLLYTSIYATKMYVYTLKRLEGKAAKSWKNKRKR